MPRRFMVTECAPSLAVMMSVENSIVVRRRSFLLNLLKLVFKNRIFNFTPLMHERKNEKNYMCATR